MDVEKFLSDEHMLTPELVSDLQTNGQLPLIEEFNGTYGLEVIRAVHQSDSWGNEIKLDNDKVNAYVMGKNNIPTCCVQTKFSENGQQLKSPRYTYKCITAFKERGDTHHTESTKMSSLMKNIRTRNAVIETGALYPLSTKTIAHKVMGVTNQETKLRSEYNQYSLAGEQYHSLLKALVNGTTVSGMQAYTSQLEEFNKLQEKLLVAKSTQDKTLSKPIYVIGYSVLGESYYEMVYERDSNGDFNMSSLHKPIGDKENFPVMIENLPNYDKYGHVLPLWAIRLKDKAENGESIVNKYFVKTRWSSDDGRYDSELNVCAWTKGNSYGWGDYDYYVGIFNVGGE
tara:strand:- start:3 stop:1028 length:1026 start_codon:yes stop_codon:yes gene_type:complete